MKRIGIDIGGTSIKIGIVENGHVIVKTSFLVDYHKKDFSQVVALIIENIMSLLKENDTLISEIEFIGIGSPGVINSSIGSVDYAANLNWEHANIVEALKSLNRPIALTNDANAAGLGEVLYGAGRDYKNVIVLTLGTGVGSAIILNKKIYDGMDGKGAELGHMIIEANGRECTCGLRGCYEAYASVSALINDTKHAMKENANSLLWKQVDGDINKVNGITPFECAKLGDSVAQNVVDNYIEKIGVGIINICNIFRPEAIIIGGGVSNQGDNLINPLKDYLKKYNYGFLNTPEPVILCAELKNDAGIIGACYIK